MRPLLDQFLDTMPRLTPTAALDILLVALLLYQAVMLIRGRRAAHILSGIGVVLLIYVVSVFAGLTVLRSILETLAPYTAFALIVMFQSEIRRLLARIGERRWVGFGSRLETREVTDEILLAVTHLAAQKIGALIVVERDIGLRTFIESGVPVDARVTRDLLLAIFQPGGAMHDGAVIVQGGRLAAGACFLPLTMNPELSRKLGTRHRAAIGVTEEADCLAIVVSEERGTVSIAALGDLEMDIPIERVAQRLGGPTGAPRYVAPASSPSSREVTRP
ncbi:diadenylate cyclase CdaA [uncultured Paludibaculum sp.]|uniref:diadenylate cyclase CdaA n=1 Tax=uncultured Paludibaculum sp. TaxID=1765020 RepID=UPI002AAA9694|nr:diadenylate cyclase CdaA [uncultured Paludibaculum sp.]